MALPNVGEALSLNDIHIEAGGATGTLATINDADIRGLIGKASATEMSFNEWYGASSTGDIQLDGITQIQTTSGSSFAITATAAERTLSTTKDVNIRIDCWGGGGRCGDRSSAASGGGAGFARGVLTLTSGSSWKIIIGGPGTNSAVFGGGGNGGSDGVYGFNGSGGGYTGLFLSSVLRTNSRIIAGGGGGGANDPAAGGVGGGSSGGDGANADFNNRGGSGGTQTAGGLGGTSSNNGVNGSALQGGAGASIGGGAGGGGGYYGGGGGASDGPGAGGGGSGYIGGVSSATLTAGSGTSAANPFTNKPAGIGDGGAVAAGNGGAGYMIITVL